MAATKSFKKKRRRSNKNKIKDKRPTQPEHRHNKKNAKQHSKHDKGKHSHKHHQNPHHLSKNDANHMLHMHLQSMKSSKCDISKHGDVISHAPYQCDTKNPFAAYESNDATYTQLIEGTLDFHQDAQHIVLVSGVPSKGRFKKLPCLSFGDLRKWLEKRNLLTYIANYFYLVEYYGTFPLIFMFDTSNQKDEFLNGIQSNDGSYFIHEFPVTICDNIEEMFPNVSQKQQSKQRKKPNSMSRENIATLFGQGKGRVYH